jgi:hypothetical protein
MSRADARYCALYRLWQAYLHMRAWGCPEYDDLAPEAREQFTELVRTGSLFTFVEDCKRDVLRAGLDVPDHWLKILSMGRVKHDAPLPTADFDQLGAILDEMYPMLVRLDPDSHPTAGPNTDRRDGNEGGMTDAVRRAGASLGWVRRERPDLGPVPGSAERYNREQFEYIREHGGPSYPLDANDRSTVPAWDTWSRYVREFLRLSDGRVNSSRRGRTSRSAVRPEELGDRRDDN